jgi:hypothetical protein
MAATNQLFRRGLASASISVLLLSFIQLALWQSVVLSFTLSFTGSKSQTRQERIRISMSSSRKQTRLFLGVTPRTLPLVLDSIANTTTASPSYTLQYSPNFQRHIVRRIDVNVNANVNTTNITDTSAANSITNTEGVVVESFRWLDQAVEKYPSAELLPLKWRLASFDENASAPSANANAPQLPPPWMVAGGGWDDESNTNASRYSASAQYPVHFISLTLPDEQAAHTARIQAVVQSVLKLFPTQVDQLLTAVPFLHYACPAQLQERLAFLLAPLPTDANVLQQVNHSAVDWPRQFYQSGQGAGMSVAQVSHALKVVPLQLLRRLPPGTGTGTGGGIMSDSAADAAADILLLAHLYEQTPSVVMEMAHQQLDPWLTGVPRQQVAAAAYLHYKGWEWTQWRVVLTALPGIVTPSEEVGWELLENGGSTAIRAPKHLKGAALQYLQLRLQVGPGVIYAMLKTHLPLTRYSVQHIRRNLNDLQSLLNLSSADLEVILVMPSLLGMSRKGIQAKVDFWMDDVGLTVEQLRQVVKRKPAVLQYSIEENLRPKLDFFCRELEIPAIDLAAKLTCSHPDVWGRSLDRHLQPMAYGFQEHATLSPAEFGRMVIQAPELLRCHFKNNLLFKMEFLRDRLGLRPDELKAMVLATPRILMQSVQYSLQPKIALLEESSTAGTKESQAVLRRNPSLLLNAHGILKERLERASSVDAENTTLSDLLNRSSAAKRARRTPKAVWLVPSDNEKVVELEFANASEAASHACISTSNMYNVLRQGRLLQGKKYVYANSTSLPAADASDVLPARKTIEIKTTLETTAKKPITTDTTPGIVSLRICAAGRAFPAEDVVRGRRRAGGLALFVPSWTLNDWRKVCTNLWTEKRMRLFPDGQTIILAYLYTRPSRPRCSLYACREALRVAAQWLDYQEEAKEMDITIETDSNYVLDLLQNTTQVLEWGKAATKDAFCYTGPAPLHQVNRDILYPLARTYYHLVQQDLPLTRTSTVATAKATSLPSSAVAQQGSRPRHNVTVRFVHSSRDLDNRHVGKVALHAARLTYDKIK